MISSDKVFIAHSSKDWVIAEDICAAVEDSGIDCWISSRDVRPGENYQDAIYAAVVAAKFMILVFTENASQSEEIKKELSLAGRTNTVIIPVRTEAIEPTGAFAYEMSTRQWIDLFKGWDRAIGSICRRIESSRSPSITPRPPANDPPDAPTPEGSNTAGSTSTPVQPKGSAQKQIGDYERLKTFSRAKLLRGAALVLMVVAVLWGLKLVWTVGNSPTVPTAAVTTKTDTAAATPTFADRMGLWNDEPAKAPPNPMPLAAKPRPKIADRVGQPSSSETVAPVAQRVVLYDEDPSDPKGKQYVGAVVWRTEQIKGSGNAPGDLAVRADVEIPERKFKTTMSFRRNTDTSLPASHTAELTFILPQNFDGGGVSNVPGILMKSNEQARGTPLAGLAVKVTDGFFLVGLSNVDADRARNLQLLKERSWFDIPLVYANQRRAIIAVEKGAPGERAFQDAFAAWGE
jgi:hypothetical protein